MLVYLGDDPPPPDQRDTPFAVGAHEGTFADVLVATCTRDNHAVIPELVRACRATFSTDELLALDPDAEVPRNFPMGAQGRAIFEQRLQGHEGEAAAWIRASRASGDLPERSARPPRSPPVGLRDKLCHH